MKHFKKLLFVFVVLMAFSVIKTTANAEGGPDGVTFTPISVNTSIQIDYPKDHNAEFGYSFAVPANGVFYVTLANGDITSSDSMWVELFDVNGAKVWGGYGSKSISSFQVGATKGGIYYVKLGCYSGVCSGGKTWYLQINYAASNYWESEDNNSARTADPISAGKTYYGVLGTEGSDEDWFKFTINKDSKVTFNMGVAYVDGESRSWEYEIVNSKNNKAVLYRGGTKGKSTVYLSKGIYYIRVSNYWSTRGVPYFIKYTTKNINVGTASVQNLSRTRNSRYSTNYYSTLKRVLIKTKGDFDHYEVQVSYTKGFRNVYRSGTYAVNSNGVNKKGIDLNWSVYYKKGTTYIRVREYCEDPFGGKIGKKNWSKAYLIK